MAASTEELRSRFREMSSRRNEELRHAEEPASSRKGGVGATDGLARSIGPNVVKGSIARGDDDGGRRRGTGRNRHPSSDATRAAREDHRHGESWWARDEEPERGGRRERRDRASRNLNSTRNRVGRSGSPSMSQRPQLSTSTPRANTFGAMDNDRVPLRDSSVSRDDRGRAASRGGSPSYWDEGRSTERPRWGAADSAASDLRGGPPPRERTRIRFNTQPPSHASDGDVGDTLGYPSEAPLNRGNDGSFVSQPYYGPFSPSPDQQYDEVTPPGDAVICRWIPMEGEVGRVPGYSNPTDERSGLHSVYPRAPTVGQRMPGDSSHVPRPVDQVRPSNYLLALVTECAARRGIRRPPIPPPVTFAFDNVVSRGATFLKFIRHGPPHERFFIIKFLNNNMQTASPEAALCWYTSPSSWTMKRSVLLADLIRVVDGAQGCALVERRIVEPGLLRTGSQGMKGTYMRAEHIMQWHFRGKSGDETIALKAPNRDVYVGWRIVMQYFAHLGEQQLGEPVEAPWG